VTAFIQEECQVDLETLKMAAKERQGLCDAIKRMIVDRLDLPIDPDWITDDQPLFGRGLELDSVDTLELMLGLEADFDLALTDDDRAAFGSVGTLAARILEERGSIVDAVVG